PDGVVMVGGSVVNAVLVELEQLARVRHTSIDAGHCGGLIGALSPFVASALAGVRGRHRRRRLPYSAAMDAGDPRRALGLALGDRVDEVVELTDTRLRRLPWVGRPASDRYLASRLAAEWVG